MCGAIGQINAMLCVPHQLQACAPLAIHKNTFKRILYLDMQYWTDIWKLHIFCMRFLINWKLLKTMSA